jgi:hypothetical protein
MEQVFPSTDAPYWGLVLLEVSKRVQDVSQALWYVLAGVNKEPSIWFGSADWYDSGHMQAPQAVVTRTSVVRMLLDFIVHTKLAAGPICPQGLPTLWSCASTSDDGKRSSRKHESSKEVSSSTEDPVCNLTSIKQAPL